MLRSDRINNNILNFIDNKYLLKLDSNGSTNKTIDSKSLIDIEKTFYASVYIKSDETNNIRLILEYLVPQKSISKSIRQTITLGDLNGISLITINQSLFSVPKIVTLKETYLGDVALNSKSENSLSLINTIETNKLPLNNPEYRPFLCDEGRGNQLFGVNNITNGLELFGKNAKVCLDIPLNNLVQNINNLDPLSIVNFQYNMPFDSRTEFCFYNNQANSCLKKNVLYPNIHKTLGHQDLIPNTLNTNNLSLRFLFDTQNLNKTSILQIKNLEINQITQSKLLKFYINLKDVSENINNSLALEGFFPSERIDIFAKQINNEKKDCAVKKSRFIDKKIVKENGVEILEYHSIEGAICETFSFSELSENSSYILAIESQNLSGLPLKICFEEDTTKKCVIEEELSSFKHMDTDYFIIPEYNNTGGYYLILRNMSIGDVESINKLKSIKIVPFPYMYIQNIKISDPKIKKERTLIFNQAFEKNWIAYHKGKKLKDHVLVNNWANGWVVEDNVNVNDVKIVFWPQYLEYLGFISLIISFVWMIFWKKKQ